MITADLVTGFLGSGKTTFIKQYARYLMKNGERVCILENDFGAVNIDMMLLGDLYAEGCGMEMVSGACDRDCHKRRFKTKLIAMAMSGYTRVVIEPSGIFDVDEFFDTLREPPLDRWYKTGSVITIIDPTLGDISEKSDYLLASQAAVAGALVFSHIKNGDDEPVRRMISRIDSAREKLKAPQIPQMIVAKPWDELDDGDFSAISESGCNEASFIKLHGDDDGFGSVYFLNIDPDPEQLAKTARAILSDKSCGHVFRVKGYTKQKDSWYELNATHGSVTLDKAENGQSVIIVIGENLDREKINEYFKKGDT